MTPMTGKRRPLLTISALALALALGATGCSKDEEPKVAAANPGAKTSVGGGGDVSPIKFSRCMREQGITWFPDPRPDGGLVVSEPDGTDHKKVEAAEKACERFDPEGSKGSPPPAEDIAKVRRASQCMREQGVSNYPDPDADGNVHVDEKMGIDEDDPTVKKARQECQKYLPTGRAK